ncbi:hypothetical protein [Streptomyces sp. MZ04]|uniref:hypothetical protein n=1 Tax=Streptomyces sp. MZ04 TaxID=2559236 RepID=UPI00107E80CE|nr:hypothetical protein [Streptomyces sp. MZ04]TGA99691.1 hypothetical protein E2651_29425 [Streptomyces sp. MZ04]
MFTRKTALRVVTPVAVLALALTACGGGDDEKAGDRPKSDAAQSEPKKDTTLTAGENATGKTKEGDATVTYDIAAQKVDVGTEAETKKLVADPKQAKGLVLI